MLAMPGRARPERRRAADDELLQQRVPDLVGRDVYVCGPPGISRAVRRALRAAGLPDAQLHEERFAL